MTTLAAASLGSLACAVWVYLLAARGGFWRASQRDDAAMPPSADPIAWPRVAIVMPARDEEDVIGPTVASLLRQNYEGNLSLIVVDDHSSDRTAIEAASAGNFIEAAGPPRTLTVLTAPPLPGGWTGKLWAVSNGIRHASALPVPAEYLLLTDADICHAPDTLTDLVRRALRERTVLTSLMAKLRCESSAERALIPAFIFFFQMLYPFAWVNRTDRSTAAAAGGCMLVHRGTLVSAGGIEAIRGELIDDCALARLLKPHGPIWIGLTERLRSIRGYRSIGDIGRMITRSAYAQLGFSPWWLAGTTAAMTLTYLTPPALSLLGSGTPQLLGALAWTGMALAFQPILRFYGVSPWWGPALPAIAAIYLVFTLASAYQHMRGRGGSWKGRVHWRMLG
jgi:hopene-associated glycosyltransferase HpnB